MASMTKRHLDNHPEENPFINTFNNERDFDYEYEMWLSFKKDEEYRNAVYQKMIECNFNNSNVNCYESNCPKCNSTFID